MIRVESVNIMKGIKNQEYHLKPYGLWFIRKEQAKKEGSINPLRRETGRKRRGKSTHQKTKKKVCRLAKQCWRCTENEGAMKRVETEAQGPVICKKRQKPVGKGGSSGKWRKIKHHDASENRIHGTINS